MLLKETRTKIEKLDAQIINLIEHRTVLAKDVLEAKKAALPRSSQKSQMPINDEDQNKIVLERVTNAAMERGLDGEGVKRIFEILINMNIERQHELSGEGNLP